MHLLTRIGWRNEEICGWEGAWSSAGRACAEGGAGRSACTGTPVDRRELYDREGGLARKEEDACGDSSVQRDVRGVHMCGGETYAERNVNERELLIARMERQEGG